MCLVLKGSSAELLGNKDLRGWRRAASAGQGLTTGSQCGLYFHRDLLQTSQSWGELCPVGSCKCLPAPQRDGGEEPCAGLRRPRLSLKWGQSHLPLQGGLLCASRDCVLNKPEFPVFPACSSCSLVLAGAPRAGNLWGVPLTFVAAKLGGV